MSTDLMKVGREMNDLHGFATHINVHHPMTCSTGELDKSTTVKDVQATSPKPTNRVCVRHDNSNGVNFG